MALTGSDAICLNIGQLSELFKNGRGILIVRFSEKAQFKIQLVEGTKLRFSYSILHSVTVRKKMDYFIDTVSITSNLKKGVVRYFICPVTGRKCRKIYITENVVKFQSRQAFTKQGQRLYYDVQLCRNMENENATKIGVIENRLKALTISKNSKSYIGKTTKRHRRIKELKQKKQDLELGDFLVGLQRLGVI